MKAHLPLLLFLSLFSLHTSAQFSELRGKVFDTDDVLIGASIQLLQNETTKYVLYTDGDGQFQADNIEPGTYSILISYQGYHDYNESSVKMVRDKLMIRNIEMILASEMLGPVVKKGQSIESEVDDDEISDDDLHKVAGTSPDDVIKLNPKISTNSRGGVSVGKNRPSGTAFFAGNSQMIGPRFLTTAGLEQISVIDNGVSARYGGFSGGAIRYTLAKPGAAPINTFQLLSSSPFNGYHHNQAMMYISRGLRVRNLDTFGRKHVKLGYSLNAVYDFKKDPSPIYGGTHILSESALTSLGENPIINSPTGSGILSASTALGADDIVTQAARNNVEANNASLQFNLLISPRNRYYIHWSNRYNYIQRRLPNTANQLLNSEKNSEQIYHYGQSRIHFQHRLKSTYDDMGVSIRDTSDLFSKVKYNMELDFQMSNSRVWDPDHQDDVFSYGYMGKFHTERRPTYEYREGLQQVFDTSIGYWKEYDQFWEYTGDGNVGFEYEMDNRNSRAAAYNNALLERSDEINDINQFVQLGGVLNGFGLQNIYSLYRDLGTVTSGYSKSHTERINLNAYIEMAAHPFKDHRIQHDLEFGFNYSQERRSNYGLNANGLWQLMPLLANEHISQLDKLNPIFSRDEQGRFTDTISYNKLFIAEDQNDFDKVLRQKIFGNKGDQKDLEGATDYLDINSMDPSTFTLDMFSADELLNNGNPYVSYSGYNHTGQLQRGQTGIGRFLNDEENRPIDPYQPIQMALWFQDKFVIRDLIVRAGLRVERFDANQSVLKDPYLLYPAKTLGEVSELGGVGVDHPDHLTDDYVVYVNDMDNPSSITGYRNGNDWYSSEGELIADPTLIANNSNGGRIQPYLVDPTNQNLQVEAFTSYKPQINVLPRLTFSFPMNTTSLFYFYYDKLAQQPLVSQSFMPYSSYILMENGANTVFANPNMKARVKTEYQIGYKQFLGEYSTLSLSASYASIKNDFNQFRIEQAYPYSYSTYSNIDFSTTKRFIAVYEMKRDHLNLNLNYALQFADGTGSNVNSQASLLQSGQPNLRTLYPLSFDNRHSIKGSLLYQFGYDSKEKKYAGPRINGKQIAKHAYISLSFQSLSGTPYTATVNANSEAQASLGVVQRTQIKGNPFGNRLPWQHTMNARIEKKFFLKSESEYSRKSVDVYVNINNLLNTRVVERVYSYTGQSNDDGYLTSPVGRQNLANQSNSQAFEMLYNLRLTDNQNVGMPRNAVLGIRWNL